MSTSTPTTPTTPRTPSSIFIDVYNGNPYIVDSERYNEVINILNDNKIEYQQTFKDGKANFILSSPHMKRTYSTINNNNNGNNGNNSPRRKLF